MSSASLKMSADAASAAPTDRKVIDEAVASVKDKAREFARLAPARKAALLRECIPRLLAEAPGWVAAGTAARDAAPSEQWLAGPPAAVPAARRDPRYDRDGGPPGARARRAHATRQSHRDRTVSRQPTRRRDVHGLHRPYADAARCHARAGARAAGRVLPAARSR